MISEVIQGSNLAEQPVPAATVEVTSVPASPVSVNGNPRSDDYLDRGLAAGALFDRRETSIKR